MKRLVIITEIISPYRIPLFNALAERDSLNLHVIFLAETDPVLRQWQVYKQEIRFSYQVLSSWRRRIGNFNVLLNRGVSTALRAAEPNVILCGGYNYLASWQALFWARTRRVPFLLWFESTQRDLRPASGGIELLKREFLRGCSGFVVPGTSSREYLLSLGQKDCAIFTALNAVDNELFACGACSARENAIERRKDLNVPQRYFLFVGRLIREKGVFDLLNAYAALDPSLREKIGLVFAGDGAGRRELEEQSKSICRDQVRFANFVHRDQLAAYYGLADVLVLPTHSDPWGLVVNEAMACGLPVIVSRAAGCSADLVRNDWNGILFSPGDVAALRAAMERLAGDPNLCGIMGRHSVERIFEFSPQSWCAGLEGAVAEVKDIN